MKKITLWMLVLFGCFQMNAQQLWQIEACLDLTSTLYGPMCSVATANSTSRTAIVYPASQLTGISGQNLSAMYFERGGTNPMLGTPNFKIYLKEIAAADFGAGALDWATATTGAVLVYDSNPVASVGETAGWKSFPFTTNFLYSGLQNLAVFFEYSNPVASNSIAWSYEFDSPCVDTGNSNTTKYTNNTTGTLPVTLATSNYRRPHIGFDYVVSCPKPTGLIVSNLTSSGADVAWTTGGTEIQWEYAAVVAGSGVPTTTALVDSNTLINTPLNPGTTYQIYVRSYCGEDDTSVWTISENFTTPCVDVVNFFENFDTSATGSAAPMPNCWGEIGNGNAYVTTGGALPGSAPNRLYMFANSGATTPTVISAILPSVSNLQANTHRLKFKAFASTVNKSFEVGYQTDLLDASTFVLLETINLPGTTPASAQEFIVIPSGIPAGVNNLVFKNPGTGSVTLYIDDVTWEAIPACADVANLTYSNITDNQVTINWTAGGTETEWQYVYGANTVTDPSTLTPVDVLTTPTQIISSLAPSTAYRIWVRSKCGTSDLGAWIGPLAVATLCTPVTAFIENFDTSETGSANPMTECWDRAGSGSVYITTGAVAPLSAPNRIYMNASGVTPTEAYVIMPPVSNLQANTHRLRFKAFASASDKILEVGYLESPSDLSTFSQIEQITGLPSTAATSQEYIIQPSDLPVGVTRLVFRVAPTAATTTLYIDDVSWEVIPSCADVSDLIAGNASSTSVAISWLAGDSETAWQYVYGPTTVTDPFTLTPIDVTDNPETTITSLTPGTAYKVWVRSNCGSGVLGVWSDPITINTTCSPVTTIAENFDSSATGSTAAMPTCWTKFGTTGAVYPQTGGALPGTPPNRLYMNTSGTTRAFAVLPPVSNLQAETHRLKFKAYATVANKTLEVGYFENSNDVSTFISLESFLMPSTTAAAATEFVLQPLGISDGVESLVFRILGTVSGATTLYVDDVFWEPIPVCVDINVLGIANLTNESTDFVWTPGDSETAWQYVYGLSTVADPTTLTPVDVTGSPTASINELTGNTSYKYWVRSNCGNGDFGNWSQPFTFITSCDAVAVFSENFDTYDTGASTPMPDCWRRVGTGTTYIATASAAPATTPNRLYMNATGSGANPTQVFAIMPPVSNLEAETHRLRFKAYATAISRTLEIGFFGDIADITTFILLQTIDLPSTNAASAQEFIINIEDVPPGITSLVFRNAGTPSGATTLYIDDVVWEAIPTTAPSCVVSTVTPDAACGNFANVITWSPAAGTAEGYNLTIGTTSGGSDVLNNQSIGNVNTYSFLGSANTTYYFTLVPFNISGVATGCVEQSFTTLATGCYCTSDPTTNSGSGITNVLLGTNNFATGDVTYFDHSATTVDLAQGISVYLNVSFSTTVSYGINVWIDFNNNFNFETSELVFQGESLSTTPSVFDASFAMPVNAALGTHRMRIGTADSGQAIPNPCYSGSSGVTLDFNVNILPAPSCLPPLSPNVTFVEATTAVLSWTASSSAPTNGYQYYRDTVNTPPTSATVPTGSVGAGMVTADLTGLSPITTYYVWVRSVCGTDEYSEWTNVISFATSCVAIDVSTVAWTEGFEGLTAAGATSFPPCWLKQNGDWRSAINSTTTYDTDAHTGTYFIQNAYSAVNEFIWTPGFQFTAGVDYDFSFWYSSYGSYSTWDASVFYNTSQSSTGAVELAPFIAAGTVAPSDYTEVINTFTPETSGVYYFAIRVNATSAPWYLSFDDFKLETEDLKNVDFNVSSLKAYPNPVKDILNLSYAENITNVEVFNLLGQQVKTIEVNSTQVQLDMSNLASGAYIVKVTVNDAVKNIKIIKE